MRSYVALLICVLSLAACQEKPRINVMTLDEIKSNPKALGQQIADCLKYNSDGSLSKIEAENCKQNAFMQSRYQQQQAAKVRYDLALEDLKAAEARRNKR